MHKLAIVVPYRDREAHLNEFILHMNNYLKNQYKIFIIEQVDDKLFNRGKLLNVGFDVCKDDYDYFALHDVDLLPTEVDYSYVDQPTHLARRLPEFHGGSAYDENFGGATLFRKEHFLCVNGFSNEYWGWGAEDDDLRLRCTREGLKIGTRNGLYAALPHARVGPNHSNYQYNVKKLRAFRDETDEETAVYRYYKTEGLTTLKYEKVDEYNTDTHTVIQVTI
jgi:hypothetical protein